MKIIVADCHNNNNFCKCVSERIAKIQDEKAEVTKIDKLEELFSILENEDEDFHFVFLNFELLGKDWKKQLDKLMPLVKKAKIVILSDCKDRKTLTLLLDAGIYSHIPNDYPEELVQMILSALFGGCRYIPPSLQYQPKCKK